MVPTFHPDLVRGVATYWWEFFKAAPHIDVAYVPIGMGSGSASAIAAKLALGMNVKIVNVASTPTAAYADSIADGRVIESPASTVLSSFM